MQEGPFNDVNRLSQPHPYPGRLIVLEGIDGSGKSTQIDLLNKWLESLGYATICTEWSSARLVSGVTQLAKRAMSLTPTTFALLHATDFAHRQAYDIIPPLKAGMVVLADRYVYTAFARDVARGVDRRWARKVYSFAVRPDLVIYLKATIEATLQRLLSSHEQIKPYEAGMDLNISGDRVESFRVFQSRLIREFNLMADEFDFVTQEAKTGIVDLQSAIRTLVQKMLDKSDIRRHPIPAAITS